MGQRTIGHWSTPRYPVFTNPPATRTRYIAGIGNRKEIWLPEEKGILIESTPIMNGIVDGLEGSIP